MTQEKYINPNWTLKSIHGHTNNQKGYKPKLNS